MGYSLTMEQVEKLEHLRREGRVCAMATRFRDPGGCHCFNRAMYRTTELTWSYGEEKDAFDADPANGPVPRLTQGTFCARHVMREGTEGVNFRVVRVERMGAHDE